MFQSVVTPTVIRDRVAAFREVLHQDDPPAAARWLMWPKSELAFAVSRTGARIMRLGNRLDPDAPNGSGTQEWEMGHYLGILDGLEMARNEVVPGLEEENEAP